MPVTERLAVTPPFDGRAVVDFLAARAIAGVEYADGDRYVRTLRLDHAPAVLDIRVDPQSVTATITADPRDVTEAREACALVFDVGADPETIGRHLSTDEALAPWVAKRPGLRVPGLPDGFEAAVRAIVGQQVSVAGARTILSRLTAEYGEPSGDPDLPSLFPTARALAAVDPESLPMPRSRARCLVDVAGAVANGSLSLRAHCHLRETREALLAIRGVGPWTADYVALRALRDPDVFLPTDLGVRHGLAKMGIEPSRVTALAEGWRPWRSYALMHVWGALG